MPETTTSNWFTDFVDWTVSLMDTLGGFGAGLAIAIENLFPPIPSEVILPLAGFAASRGSLQLWEVLVWTTAGSLVGAVVLYGLGVLLGRDRLRKIVDWLPLMEVSDFDKTEAWFIKHGTQAVFFGRMIPLFRSLISIPAGVTKMPMAKFLIFTFMGSAIWNTIFVLAGYFLGEQWHIVEQYADIMQYVVIGIVLLLIAVFVILRVRKILTQRKNSQTDSEATQDQN